MADYEIDLGTIKFNFTPSLENAPNLLMDLASLLESLPKSADLEKLAELEPLREQVSALSSQLREASITNSTLRSTISHLEEEIIKLRQEIQFLSPTPTKLEPRKKSSKAEKSVSTTPQEIPFGKPHAIPAIGERIRIAPHGDYNYWHHGTLKGYKTRSIFTVRPDNHGQDIDIERKFVKRFKSVQEALAASNDATP